MLLLRWCALVAWFGEMMVTAHYVLVEHIEGWWVCDPIWDTTQPTRECAVYATHLSHVAWWVVGVDSAIAITVLLITRWLYPSLLGSEARTERPHAAMLDRGVDDGAAWREAVAGHATSSDAPRVGDESTCP